MRRLLHSPTFYAFALVLVPLIALALSQWDLSSGALIGGNDPDSWLRLTLVRDWLSGGSWYDHTMHQSNAPTGGISSPWTRPLDVAIALVTQLQPASIALNTRLLHAGMILPPVWALLLFLGLRQALNAISPLRNAIVIAALCFLSSLAMWGYYSGVNADHHGLLAALFIGAMANLLHATPTRRQIITSGILLGLQLWISPEAFPLIAAIYVYCGLQWLGGERTKLLPRLSTTVAIAVALAVMIERPVAAWFTPIYDSISIVYVLMLSLAALVAWLLYYVQPATLKARLALASATLAAAIGILALTYPTMLHGALAEAHPFIFTHFLPSVYEALPAYHNTPARLLSFLIQPLAALAFAVLALKHAPAICSRRHLLQLLYFFTVTGLLYFTQQRFYYYFLPVTILLLAPMLTALFTPASVRTLWPARALATKPQEHQALYRMPLLLAILLLPTGLQLGFPAPQTTIQKQMESCRTTLREWLQTGALDQLGDKPLTIFTNRDIGGEVMFWTPHRIIASNYHREGAGIEYLWNAYDITDTDALRRTLATRQVDLLMLCPVKDVAGGSALQAIRLGWKTPAWLTRIPMPAARTPVDGAAPALFLVRRESHL